jgi:hypothetical protein
VYDDDKVVRERQHWIRRQMADRGILTKMAQHDGGWKNPTTIQSWFPADEKAEPAIMSVAGLHRLLRTKALPVDLLSALLPEGLAIIQVPQGIDYDDISTACRDYIDAKERAHHPESEAGRDIGPRENAELAGKVMRLRA